MNSSITCSNI